MYEENTLNAEVRALGAQQHSVRQRIPTGSNHYSRFKMGWLNGTAFSPALLTPQIKSTTAELASNSTRRAICSRRLQPTHILPQTKAADFCSANWQFIRSEECLKVHYSERTGGKSVYRGEDASQGKTIYHRSINMNRCEMRFVSPEVISPDSFFQI